MQLKNHRVLIATILIVILGITSCKKRLPDLDNNNPQELIGTWISANEDDLNIEAGIIGGIIETIVKKSGFKMPNTMIFNTDSTGTMSYDDATGTFTYKHTPGGIIVKFSVLTLGGVDVSSEPVIFAYHIDTNKKMTLKADMTSHFRIFLKEYKNGGLGGANLISKAEIIGVYNKK